MCLELLGDRKLRMGLLYDRRRVMPGARKYQLWETSTEPEMVAAPTDEWNVDKLREWSVGERVGEDSV